MRRRVLLAGLALLPLAAPGRGLAQPAQGGGRTPYPERPEVQAFIEELAARTGLPRDWIERVLADGRYSEAAERLTTPGVAGPRNWRTYRARALDAGRVNDGLAFLRRHRATLIRAADTYGVPESVIVSIIGMETHYGRFTGTYRVLDVLLTLAFDYTRRAALYREQLGEFLLLCREQKLDPLAQRGSFAGAMGLPQFMPQAIRQWAVDFDGKGGIDLARSTADAIGSVANFLRGHGWEPGLPVQLPAQADAEVMEILGHGIRAVYRWQDVAALGVRIDGELEPDTRVLLIDLDGFAPDETPTVEYRLGTANLAALLQYNRSFFYAAAVADLAETIGRRALA